MIKFVQGDLIQLIKDGCFDVVVHGCNCFNTMNSGIAKQLRETWPQIYMADCKTIKGDERKLGTWSKVYLTEEDCFILNMYTQYRYGYSGKLYANYDAIRSGMRKLASEIGEYKIGMPKIGSGKAGGNWDIILSIIEAELGHCDVTIVEWDKS
jgi:O-acetyl-ADP-ribose deacetylase (regulator of RNase III)